MIECFPIYEAFCGHKFYYTYNIGFPIKSWCDIGIGKKNKTGVECYDMTIINIKAIYRGVKLKYTAFYDVPTK